MTPPVLALLLWLAGVATAAAETRLEAYPVTDEPVSAIRIITSRPLDGEHCREALFDGRPLVRARQEAAAQETIAIPLTDLCLLELRNDAPSRALEIRADEPLATIAITADQQLFRGLTLAPGQSTVIPIRTLPVGDLSVIVDILWADDDAAPVQSFTLRFTPD
ncbi:hypothetical protein [Acuticoccus kandeliae]|uniref:hypothetical protein n=1 Tax=Acuticoccus kandeliae TaxID=2073160 RepID=UPI000D3EC39F|nr:hypothetical protein [Acuticoccus kandeliae]